MLEQRRLEDFEDVVRSDLEANGHCQGLPGVLIENREYLTAATIAGLVVDDADGLTPFLCGQAPGFWWQRVCLRINLSSSSSATIVFIRAFSFSRLFIMDS
ncbi:MAG: hypothetical protein AAF739_12325 [Pseudomonadota bacterium]